MIENLLWEKYRPSEIEDLILLPRVREVVKDGVNSNLILFGHFGTGKTSLARILVKGKPVIYFNTSLNTSIEVLREDIQNYVDTISDVFSSSDDGYKYVFLDEFEEASSKYQNALKAFMEDEKYSKKVRYIFVTNHIHKVEPGIISRCTQLDFNPNTEEEIRWWKTECKKRLLKISNEESIDIPEVDVKRIVSHNFPDLRQMVNIISNVKLTGKVDYVITSFNNELKSSLYNVLMNGSIVDIQKFIMEHFGPEKIQELFNLCGRPLLEILITKNSELLKTEKLGDIYTIVSEHSMWLNTIKGGDPVVTGTSCLSIIQKIINK